MSDDTIVYSTLLAQRLEETETAVARARETIKNGRAELWAAFKRREVDRIAIYELALELIDTLDTANDELLNAQAAAGLAAEMVGPWNKKRPSVEKLLNQLSGSHANPKA